MLVVVLVGGAALAGCGGGTKTVTQTREVSPSAEEPAGAEQGEGSVSLGGSAGERANYPSLEAVGKAIVADIEERYGDIFESGECEDFAPQMGGAPVYICEIKIGGEWHGNIQATIHPDGSFEWVDLSGAREEYEGNEVSVSE